MEPMYCYQASEITLSYKPQISPSLRPQVICSRDAYQILLNTWDTNAIEFFEQFKIILLNSRKRVLGIYTVSTGGLADCPVDPRLIFASALLSCATSIILAHNHPSGGVSPSTNDIEVTKRLAEAGALLMIPIVDHIIVATECYFSFGDEGMV